MNSTMFYKLNSVAWGLYFMLLLLLGEVWNASLEQQVILAPFTIFIAFIISSVLRKIFNRYWDLPAMKRIALYAFSVLALTYLWTAICYSFSMTFLGRDPTAGPYGLIGWAHYNLFIMTSWCGAYFSLKYFKLHKESTERALKAETLVHEAKLQALRYQLNPHFLFNALNAISTLVLAKENELAVKAVNELSYFLRYSLDNNDQKKNTLSEEIKLLERYIHIEDIRFSERMQVRFDIEESSKNCLIPTLLLQPLVENVIKHVVSHQMDMTNILVQSSVQEDRVIVIVQDNGPTTEVQAKSIVKTPGVGTKNIIDRLKLFYPDNHDIDFISAAPHGLKVAINIPAEYQ